MMIFFRIRKGDIRIIFLYSNDGDIVVSLIENIGFRGDIYK
jgi:mRNA-degrading endonuclease RelE of RelBE toxin-antitoxin system